MLKTKTKDQSRNLPEPVALTPDQLKEIVTETAGGLSLPQTLTVIRQGGMPALQVLTVGTLQGAAY